MQLSRDLKRSRVYMNPPNKLTIGRIFLVPFVIVFLVVGEKVPNYTAGAIFLAAVLTDWLDGRIARTTRTDHNAGEIARPDRG
ncbi:MAG: CDP-alcohol phosphatidyltransferase family protein [Candidatus Methylomirabilis sp.]|nr:CDP-alcohol phosphatidyltransferase family protein [Candidatus Methylomirabilis sp.]